MAQAKPDFTGTWTLNLEKSDPPLQGRGGGGAGSPTVTIKQSANDLVIATGFQMLSFTLDGTETIAHMTGRGGNEFAIKAAARWDGDNLVTETTRDFPGAPLKTKEIRRLEAGGRVMHVETIAQTPQGEQKRNLVYVKEVNFEDPCKVRPDLPICGKKS